MNKEEKVVFECSFGMETYGKVVEISDNKFQCYETPLFGGEWQQVGSLFDNKNDAIQYLIQLT